MLNSIPISRQLIKTWLRVGLAVLCIGLFVEISSELNEISEGDMDAKEIDEKILLAVSNLRVTWLNGPAVDLTALGSWTLISLFSIVLLTFFYLLKEKFSFYYTLFAAIGAGLLSVTLKNLYMRDRPSIVEPLVEVSSYSYPSGHSLGAGAFYMTLSILACRYISGTKDRLIIFSLSIFIISLVALSRLYLGVHYPSDVAGGLLLGIAWALLLPAIMNYLKLNKVEDHNSTNKA